MCVVFTIASPNGLTWYLSSDQFEEEESVVVHDRRLPLYLNSHKISEVKDGYTVSLLYMVVGIRELFHWMHICISEG